jgi:hypothetical protein
MSDAASGPPHALFSPHTPSRRVHYHPLAQAFLLSHTQDGGERVLAQAFFFGTLRDFRPGCPPVKGSGRLAGGWEIPANVLSRLSYPHGVIRLIIVFEFFLLHHEQQCC